MAVSREAALRELARRELARRQKPAEPEYRVTDEMSTGERLLAGIGGGMVEAGRKATNFVLPDALTPEWASDEAIAEQARIDQDLDSTGAGMAGKILGQTAISAPVGGAVGGGLKAALAASKGARGAALLGAARGYGPGRAAVEGAVEGAMLANPDDRAGGALAGGLFGGGAGLVAAGGGKLLRKAMVDKSPEAAALEARMARYAEEPGDEFIPISQAAEPGLGRQFYEGIVANIPGAGQKLRGQYNRALQTFRETAMAESLPAGASLDQILRHGDDIQKGIASAQEAWDAAFDQVKALKKVDLKFNIPKDIADEVERLSNGRMKLPKGGVVTGQQALDLKKQLQEIINANRGEFGRPFRAKVQAIRDKVEERILSTLQRNSRLINADPAQAVNYQFNMARWPNWRKFRGAAESATGNSKFTPTQLANKATRMSGKKGIEGKGGELQDLGKLGMEALQPFPSRQGIFQTVAALGTIAPGAALGGLTAENPVMGSGLGIAGTIGAGMLLARPGVQRRLMGQFSRPEQLMAEALRRSGRLSRSAAIPAYLENQDEP